MARSPLYDHERSQTSKDRSDERKGEDKEVARKAKDASDERKGEQAMEARKATDKADESAGMKEHEAAEAGEDKGIDKMMEGFKTLTKAHESERRDMHGNHREAMRQMHARHEKQLRDFMEMNAPAMGAAPQGEGGADTAGGAAAEAPAGGEGE